MGKVVIKFENGVYRLYDDGKYVGVVEKKNYPKDRDPSGYIWKLPANSLGRQWLTYKKLEGVLEYELTDAHVDRGSGVKTSSSNSPKVGFMDVAKLALSEEELKTLTSLINKVQCYTALANAKREMEEAQKKYEELLKLSQGTQEEEEEEETTEEEEVTAE